MSQHDQMLEDLLALIYLTGGQAPRATELLCLEHWNGISTTRGVYIHDGSVLLVSRHFKARTDTNHEFQVGRFLPYRVACILYQYLFYIRPFIYMLQRQCYRINVETSLLFCSVRNPSRLWGPAILSKALQRATQSSLGYAFGIRIYRQISIAITEKHIREISGTFNRFEDR